MTYTTATLDIGNWTTELRLTGDGWKPRQPRQFINVIPPGHVPADHVPFFRASADAALADAGYRRTSEWVHDAGRGDVHTATIEPTV